jgi:hypothetical protein
MLASMSEIDPRADTPLVDWGEVGVSGLLPTGTVTLLLADVEGSTPLWETRRRPSVPRGTAMATSLNDTAPVVHARAAAATLIDAALAAPDHSGSRG